jgi:hypothetical protein
MAMGNDKSLDERAMPCERIFLYAVEQLTGQHLATQKTPGNFGPSNQKEQNADQNAQKSEITQIGRLLEITD